MGRLAPMDFFAVLILIFCEHFILKINATFYVEVHDRGDEDSIGLSLFECNVPAELRRSRSTGSSRTLVSSYSTDDDISCTQVTNRQRKREIYSTTNFHLVVNPRLPGNKRILLGPARPAPFNTFLGVTIVGTGAVDYPSLLSDLDQDSRSRLRTKCIQLYGRFLPYGGNVEMLATYMGLTNFRQFAFREQRWVERFQLCANIVGIVQNKYRYNVIESRENDISDEEQRTTIGYVKGALSILLSKLIDPCFVESYIQESGQRLTTAGIAGVTIHIADRMCENYCLLMATALSLYSVPSVCRGQLTGGQCQNRVCKCEKRSKSLIVSCASRPKFVAMIECSNDLRTGLADIVDFGA